MRQPAFDIPQWRFYGAPEPVDYFVCEGVVQVDPENGEGYNVCVTVPTEFVKFLHDIGHLDRVTLFLDQMDRRWVFGYELPDGTGVDLWHYTANSFPLWANHSGDGP